MKRYEERRDMTVAIVAAILVAGRGGHSAIYDAEEIAAEAASLYFAVQRVFRPERPHSLKFDGEEE